MQSGDQDRLTAMESEAEKHSELGESDEAEQLYREILNTRIVNEGPEASYRDMYNLSAVLVRREKYEEAEPMLRQLLTYLTQRQSGRETRNFIEQEEGTARLLVQALEGQGSLVEARQNQGTASKLDDQVSHAI